VLLALLLGFDGPAEGHGARSFELDANCRALCRPGPRHHRERYRVLRGKAVLRYGLGNGLTFPMAVGATSVLMGERPTTAAVSRVLREHQPTSSVALRRSTTRCSPATICRMARSSHCGNAFSAGEPLPQEIGRRWSARIGVDILDGIGSTEMLPSFSATGRARCGTALPARRSPVTSSDRRRRGEAGSARRNR